MFSQKTILMILGSLSILRSETSHRFSDEYADAAFFIENDGALPSSYEDHVTRTVQNNEFSGYMASSPPALYRQESFYRRPVPASVTDRRIKFINDMAWSLYKKGHETFNVDASHAFDLIKDVSCGKDSAFKNDLGVLRELGRVGLLMPDGSIDKELMRLFVILRN